MKDHIHVYDLSCPNCQRFGPAEFGCDGSDNPYLFVYLYRRIVDAIDERTLHRILNTAIIAATMLLVATIIFVAFMMAIALSGH